MSSVAAPHGACTALPDLDTINDEEKLRTMWQTAEDFGDRRRIRARMYRLREQRLREMMQNDEESLGTLNVTDEGGLTETTETTISVSDDGKTTTRRSSNIKVTMHVDGDSAVTDSISTQNVRLGGLTMRGIDTVNMDADEIINDRIRKASKDRTTRYQQIIGGLSDTDGNSDGEAVVSITKSTYSIQSNALAGEGYISMKNKEVRDSVSPTRILRERRSSAEEDNSANDGRLTSDDEAALKTESENVIKAIETSVPKTSSSRKTSREERTSSTRTSKTTRQSEIPVRKDSPRKVSERKISKELDLSSTRRNAGDKSSPTSPTKRTPGDSSAKTHTSRRTGAQKETSSSKESQKTESKSSSSSKKSKLAEIEAKMESSIKSELDKLDSYLKTSGDDDDEIIMEEEEDCVDEAGNVVKMLVQTRRKKDGTECTARRVARSTKIVNSESEIDEILIGNPEHEVIERNVEEEEDKDGNKIKIITETRRRPDGITYTTKNVLKTSKIFDYDHPEDVAYNEEDELISTNETEETDENGCSIQTVTETRRKANGVEYTTKKVYKTSKVKSTQISPSDDDEIIDIKETEEKKDDGSIIRTVIETRRTKNGEEYTHRQVFKSRRMTLSGVDLQEGLPTVQNDDEVLSKSEKVETDENGTRIRIVTETRRRNDGSTYSFDYVLRSFQGTEEDVMNMPVSASSSSNIAVSAEDELLNEEVKEDVEDDGSTVKTIIERRRAKDGTEYLRHRVMRIPKMPEPVLQVGNLEDEVLQEDVKEETLDDGTQYKAVTERRRSSVSGLQYTLRRMSRVYQHPTLHPKGSEDEILDENVVEEETDDGTIIKTVIQRYQRPDGSVYTTHNIQKMFSSPAPVTFVGTEDDELIDQTVDEQETEDGCIIKTVTEIRQRSDGVQYTVERAEKTTKYGPQVHITFNANQQRKPEDVVQMGSLDDTVLSSEEQEYEEEDGTVVKTIIEIRRRVDGTEYTAKTVLRSTPVLVPERETSYVIIKPEGEEEDESGLFPSMDDELVYTRKREEKDEYGNPITVIIETRQSKITGEKYNITKRVHTKDVLLTDEGEKEIPKKTVKSTLVANLKPGTSSKPGQKKPVSSTQEDRDDDVPYGSVSALKNRFAPGTKKTESTPKSFKPDRSSTSNKKKFFEDAAREAAGKSPSTKSSSSKPLKTTKEPFPHNKASIEVKLRVEEDHAKVEDVSAQNISYNSEDITVNRHDDAEQNNFENLDYDQITKHEKENYERDSESEAEPLEEPAYEKEIESDDLSPAEEEPQEIKPKKTVETKKPTSVTKKPDERTKRRSDVSPTKKPETSRPVRKQPAKDDSPPRRIQPQRDNAAPRESVRRAPKPNTSPQRVPSSPRRGRSPNRSGITTPREVTPTGRQCCKRHREANAPETVSPTRTQKTPRSAAPPVKKAGSPEGKPRMNGDIRRSTMEPKINGDISKRPEDRSSRLKKLPEKSNETEKTTGRPSRNSQSPTKRAPTARSPEKREPVRPTSSKITDKKSPSKPISAEGKEKPKSSLHLQEPVDPIVTLPETPMIEDMKPLPLDEDVVIEDVSNEPDLPYHSIHRPSLVREPSEYQGPDTDGQPENSFEESPEEKEPVKEEISKSRKPKPLESRPSDKSLTSKKQLESKKPVRDRPWLSEKRNSFEKRPSETKLTTDKKKPFERKPSDDKLKKQKEEKKLRKSPSVESYPSEDESKENGLPQEREPLSAKENQDTTERGNKKVDDISSRYIEEVEKSIASQIISDKNIPTTDVSARRSIFSRATSTDKKKDTPTRKPSYEMKESVFSKRSMFEQPKHDSAPSPIKRPSLKSTIRKDDSYKKPEQPKASDQPKKLEERKPVEEPLIVPKYFHPLGDEDEEHADEVVKKVVEEEIELSSSKLVMNASAEISKTSKKYESEMYEVEDSNTPQRKESSSSQYMREISPGPRSKEGSPAPFSKEGSPNRFTTGKPVDSGINANKIRRIERTASNKKLFEDLEVSRDTLPEYIKKIDSIFEVTVLESMLEQAESYEERRIIRGQLRIAKKHSSQSTTSTTTATPLYKRFVESTPSRPSPTASPQPVHRDEPKKAKVEPKDSVKEPLSRSEETRPSTDDQSDSLIAKDTTSPRRKVLRDEPSEEIDTTPLTREPSSRLNKKVVKEPSPEPKEVTGTLRSRRSDADLSSPREPKKDVKPEESPRSRFGRTKTPEEPKKYESPSSPREPSKTSKVQPLSSKVAPSNEPYSEPLRYQKKQGSTPSKPAAPQSHVDTIVSAYGVGPTDDNGMPLFGLRALKKRSPPTASESTPREEEKPAPSEEELNEPVSQEKTEPEYEPTDASGQPIFGLRALKKATTSVNATERAVERSEEEEIRETASSVVESSRLVSGIVTQRQTHATELVSSESPQDSESSESDEPLDVESEEEAEHLEPYYEEETSPGLVRSLRDSFKRKETTEDLQSSGKAEDEVITKRSQPLRDILKLHEAKVQEPATVVESPRLKPKQRLRENFEVPERQDSRVHKTWDLESDLSTRSQDMRNIIARHETITSEASPKPEKKLTGILKKTSSTNILGTDKSSSTINEKSTLAEARVNSSMSEQLNTTDDILDTLTEDQITQLSKEFDLRAQDDGVIKTEESIEELRGGYRVSTRTEGEYPDGAKFERKTSYTEIKLQQPNKEERTRDLKNPDDDKKEAMTSDSYDADTHILVSKTQTSARSSQIDETVIESVIQSVKESSVKRMKKTSLEKTEKVFPEVVSDKTSSPAEVDETEGLLGRGRPKPDTLGKNGELIKKQPTDRKGYERQPDKATPVSRKPDSSESNPKRLGRDTLEPVDKISTIPDGRAGLPSKKKSGETRTPKVSADKNYMEHPAKRENVQTSKKKPDVKQKDALGTKGKTDVKPKLDSKKAKNLDADDSVLPEDSTQDIIDTLESHISNYKKETFKSSTVMAESKFVVSSHRTFVAENATVSKQEVIDTINSDKIVTCKRHPSAQELKDNKSKKTTSCRNNDTEPLLKKSTDSQETNLESKNKRKPVDEKPGSSARPKNHKPVSEIRDTDLKTKQTSPVKTNKPDEDTDTGKKYFKGESPKNSENVEAEKQLFNQGKPEEVKSAKKTSKLPSEKSTDFKGKGGRCNQNKKSETVTPEKVDDEPQTVRKLPKDEDRTETASHKKSPYRISEKKEDKDKEPGHQDCKSSARKVFSGQQEVEPVRKTCDRLPDASPSRKKSPVRQDVRVKEPVDKVSSLSSNKLHSDLIETKYTKKTDKMKDISVKQTYSGKSEKDKKILEAPLDIEDRTNKASEPRQLSPRRKDETKKRKSLEETDVQIQIAKKPGEPTIGEGRECIENISLELVDTELEFVTSSTIDINITERQHIMERSAVESSSVTLTKAATNKIVTSRKLSKEKDDTEEFLSENTIVIEDKKALQTSGNRKDAKGETKNRGSVAYKKDNQANDNTSVKQGELRTKRPLQADDDVEHDNIASPGSKLEPKTQTRPIQQQHPKSSSAVGKQVQDPATTDKNIKTSKTESSQKGINMVDKTNETSKSHRKPRIPAEPGKVSKDTHSKELEPENSSERQKEESDLKREVPVVDRKGMKSEERSPETPEELKQRIKGPMQPKDAIQSDDATVLLKESIDCNSKKLKPGMKKPGNADEKKTPSNMTESEGIRSKQDKVTESRRKSPGRVGDDKKKVNKEPNSSNKETDSNQEKQRVTEEIKFQRKRSGRPCKDKDKLSETFEENKSQKTLQVTSEILFERSSLTAKTCSTTMVDKKNLVSSELTVQDKTQKSTQDVPEKVIGEPGTNRADDIPQFTNELPTRNEPDGMKQLDRTNKLETLEKKTDISKKGTKGQSIEETDTAKVRQGKKTDKTGLQNRPKETPDKMPTIEAIADKVPINLCDKNSHKKKVAKSSKSETVGRDKEVEAKDNVLSDTDKKEKRSRPSREGKPNDKTEVKEKQNVTIVKPCKRGNVESEAPGKLKTKPSVKPVKESLLTETNKPIQDQVPSFSKNLEKDMHSLQKVQISKRETESHVSSVSAQNITSETVHIVTKTDKEMFLDVSRTDRSKTKEKVTKEGEKLVDTTREHPSSLDSETRKTNSGEKTADKLKKQVKPVSKEHRLATSIPGGSVQETKTEVIHQDSKEFMDTEETYYVSEEYNSNTSSDGISSSSSESESSETRKEKGKLKKKKKISKQRHAHLKQTKVTKSTVLSVSKAKEVSESSSQIEMKSICKHRDKKHERMSSDLKDDKKVRRRILEDLESTENVSPKASDSEALRKMSDVTGAPIKPCEKLDESDKRVYKSRKESNTAPNQPTKPKKRDSVPIKKPSEKSPADIETAKVVPINMEGTPECTKDSRKPKERLTARKSSKASLHEPEITGVMTVDKKETDESTDETLKDYKNLKDKPVPIRKSSKASQHELETTEVLPSDTTERTKTTADEAKDSRTPGDQSLPVKKISKSQPDEPETSEMLPVESKETTDNTDDKLKHARKLKEKPVPFRKASKTSLNELETTKTTPTNREEPTTKPIDKPIDSIEPVRRPSKASQHDSKNYEVVPTDTEVTIESIVDSPIDSGKPKDKPVPVRKLSKTSPDESGTTIVMSTDKEAKPKGTRKPKESETVPVDREEATKKTADKPVASRKSVDKPVPIRRYSKTSLQEPQAAEEITKNTDKPKDTKESNDRPDKKASKTLPNEPETTEVIPIDKEEITIKTIDKSVDSKKPKDRSVPIGNSSCKPQTAQQITDDKPKDTKKPTDKPVQVRKVSKTSLSEPETMEVMQIDMEEATKKQVDKPIDSRTPKDDLVPIGKPSKTSPNKPQTADKITESRDDKPKDIIKPKDKPVQVKKVSKTSLNEPETIEVMPLDMEETTKTQVYKPIDSRTSKDDSVPIGKPSKISLNKPQTAEKITGSTDDKPKDTRNPKDKPVQVKKVSKTSLNEPEAVEVMPVDIEETTKRQVDKPIDSRTLKDEAVPIGKFSETSPNKPQTAEMITESTDDKPEDTRKPREKPVPVRKSSKAAPNEPEIMDVMPSDREETTKKTVGKPVDSLKPNAKLVPIEELSKTSLCKQQTTKEITASPDIPKDTRKPEPVRKVSKTSPNEPETTEVMPIDGKETTKRKVDKPIDSRKPKDKPVPIGKLSKVSQNEPETIEGSVNEPKLTRTYKDKPEPIRKLSKTSQNELETTEVMSFDSEEATKKAVDKPIDSRKPKGKPVSIGKVSKASQNEPETTEAMPLDREAATKKAVEKPIDSRKPRDKSVPIGKLSKTSQNEPETTEVMPIDKEDTTRKVVDKAIDSRKPKDKPVPVGKLSKTSPSEPETSESLVDEPNITKTNKDKPAPIRKLSKSSPVELETTEGMVFDKKKIPEMTVDEPESIKQKPESELENEKYVSTSLKHDNDDMKGVVNEPEKENHSVKKSLIPLAEPVSRPCPKDSEKDVSQKPSHIPVPVTVSQNQDGKPLTLMEKEQYMLKVENSELSPIKHDKNPSKEPDVHVDDHGDTRLQTGECDLPYQVKKVSQHVKEIEKTLTLNKTSGKVEKEECSPIKIRLSDKEIDTAIDRESFDKDIPNSKDVTAFEKAQSEDNEKKDSNSVPSKGEPNNPITDTRVVHREPVSTEKHETENLNANAQVLSETDVQITQPRDNEEAMDKRRENESPVSKPSKETDPFLSGQKPDVIKDVSSVKRNSKDLPAKKKRADDKVPQPGALEPKDLEKEPLKTCKTRQGRSSSRKKKTNEQLESEAKTAPKLTPNVKSGSLGRKDSITNTSQPSGTKQKSASQQKKPSKPEHVPSERSGSKVSSTEIKEQKVKKACEPKEKESRRQSTANETNTVELNKRYSASKLDSASDNSANRHARRISNISRKSSTPEPEEAKKRVKKVSKPRKSSLDHSYSADKSSDENIETRTYSMQSLSALSTTSSVPSYMKPRGESCSCRRHTPERDIHEVEESLLNAYKYTRCTKKVTKSPVTYSYTYTVSPDDGGGGGGGGSYSIYFGPKDKLPRKENDTEKISSKPNVSDGSHQLPLTGSPVLAPYQLVDSDSYPDIHTSNLHEKETCPHDIQERNIESDSYGEGKPTTHKDRCGHPGYFDSQPRCRDSQESEPDEDTANPYVSPSQPAESTILYRKPGGYSSHVNDPSCQLRESSPLKKDVSDDVGYYMEPHDTVRENPMSYSHDLSERSVPDPSSEHFTDGMKTSSKIADDTYIRNTAGISSDTMNYQKDSMYQVVDNQEKSSLTSLDKRSNVGAKEFVFQQSDLIETPRSKPDNDHTRELSNQYAEATENIQHHSYDIENKTYDESGKSYRHEKSDIRSSQTAELHDTNKTHCEYIDHRQPHSRHMTVEERCDDKSHEKDMYSVSKISETSGHYISDCKQFRELSELQPATSITRGDYMVHKRDGSGNIEVGSGRYVTDRTNTCLDGRTMDDPPAGYVRHDQDGDGSWRVIGGRETHLSANNWETQEKEQQHTSSEHRSRVVTSSSSATVEHTSGASFSSSNNREASSRYIGAEEDEDMREGRSFLEDRSKVSGFGDVLSRMGATEAVDHDSKVTSDDQARSLLNKFLGAQVLMTGVESMMASSSISESSRMVSDGDGRTMVTKQASGHSTSAGAKDGKLTHHSTKSFNTGPQTTALKGSSAANKAEPVIVCGVNISEVTDDFELNQLLDSCDQYEDRRKIRMRLKTLMADKKALGAELRGHDLGRGSHTQGSSAQKFEAMSKTTTDNSKESSLRSSEGDFKASSTVSPFGTSRTSATETRSSSQVNVQKSSYSSNVSSSTTSSFKTSTVSKTDNKSTVSPFDKFKQMDTQSPRTPNSKSKSAGGGPLFQLSSQLSRSASGVKDMLLQWCQCRTRDYKGIKIENFSTSWNDGMAFCALIHHFYPDAFDFDKLEPKNRRYNFELAFRVADEKAGVYPLLDVEDMVMMKKPDWKCVFTYVQALYKRLKDE